MSSAAVTAYGWQSWSRFTARHPEWWVAGMAAAAGAAILASQGDAGGAHHHHRAAGDAIAAEMWSWALMTMAMMLPVFVPRARRVAWAAVGRTRTRAIAETLIGYLLVWLAVGACVALMLPSPGAGGSTALVAAWLAVAAWQCTGVRYRVLNRCHAVGVPPGTRDGLRRVTAGMAYGRWCAVTCGPAMAAMAVTELPPVLMGALAAGLLAERIAVRPRTASLRLAAVIVAGTLLAAVA
jgi:hypothetical protein